MKIGCMVRILLLLLFVPILSFGQYFGKAKFLKQIPKEEYDSLQTSDDEKDWIQIEKGKIDLFLIRTKKEIKDIDSTRYYIVDHFLMSKDTVQTFLKSIAIDLHPLISDDVYTIRYIEGMSVHHRWKHFLLRDRFEAAEKIIRFYNTDITFKRDQWNGH